MSNLPLPPDYRDLLLAFVEAGVEFVLVGGWAVAAHGHGRATDDLDVLVRLSARNAGRVHAALRSFGAPLDAVDEGLFAQPRYGFRMGRKPLMIEVLTTVDGITFDQAVEDALHVEVEGTPVPVIGREALLRNKRASGRVKDLADVEALEAGE